VLRPLAGRQGFHYSTYERLGYSRFAVNEVGYTNQTTRIFASRFEGFVPIVWLWHLRVRNNLALEPFARANQWVFGSLPGPPAEQKPPGPAHDEVQGVAATLRVLQRWLPIALLSNGTVRVGETTVAVPALSLTGGNLRAQAQLLLKGRDVPLAA